MKQSSRETHFLTLWRMLGKLGKEGEPINQHRFHETRFWRFDFAWPEFKVAVEIHGGEFRNGGHNRGLGLRDDCEKLRAAQLLGWIVLPYVGTDLDRRPADVIEEIRDALLLRRRVGNQ